MTAILETVSEKPKRGRPPVYLPEHLALARFVTPDVKTTRGLQNTMRRQRALALVMDAGKDDPALLWLMDPAACARGEARWQPLILAELGRIDTDADLLAMARHVADLRPTAKVAVALIRRWRLQASGQVPRPASCLDLTNEIINVANAYIDRHPDVTLTQSLTALINVREAFDPDMIEATA